MNMMAGSRISLLLFLIGVSIEAPVSAQVINACVDNKQGTLRIVPTSACKSSESPLSWNQAGPQGPQGIAGVAGTMGPPGPAGPQGPIGSAGPAGDTGPAGPQGPIGLTGAPGQAGPTGPQGLSGTTGQSTSWKEVLLGISMTPGDWSNLYTYSINITQPLSDVVIAYSMTTDNDDASDCPVFYRVVIPGTDTYLSGMTARGGSNNYNHESQTVSVALPAGTYPVTIQGQPNCTMWASRLLLSTSILNR